MANVVDPATLVGRRFATDFTVEAVGMRNDATGEQMALLRRNGEAYLISTHELLVTIEMGFVLERGADS